MENIQVCYNVQGLLSSVKKLAFINTMINMQAKGKGPYVARPSYITVDYNEP